MYDGLILYHGVRSMYKNSEGDYVAFELVDGHLFFIINLGSGNIRLQANNYLHKSLSLLDNLQANKRWNCLAQRYSRKNGTNWNRNSRR